MRNSNSSFVRLSLLATAALAMAVVACGSPQPSQPTSAGAGTPGPQQPLQQVTVALDWYPWSNHTGLFMAQENGYYRDVGLEVKTYVPSNPEDVLKLVAAGRDTFGISYQSDVLLAGSEGIPVKSVAAMVQRPLNSVMALKSSGITRPKDLEGKKVGYPGIPGHEALLATMLEKDGSSIDKIQLVNVGFDLLPALIGKSVDAVMGAYWVHESIMAEQQGHPVNFMKVENWGVPSYYELVMVTSDKMVKEQPDLVKRFLWATARGYSKVVEDPAKGLDLLVKANQETDRKVEEQGIQLLMPLWTDTVQAWGWQEAYRWDRLAAYMTEKKLLTRPVKAEDVFVGDLITK